MFQVLCRQSKGEPNRFSVVSKQLRRWISRKPFRNYDGKGENLYFKRHIARVIDSWKLKEFENWLISLKKKKIEVKDFWNRLFLYYIICYIRFIRISSRFDPTCGPYVFYDSVISLPPVRSCLYARTHTHMHTHDTSQFVISFVNLLGQEDGT